MGQFPDVENAGAALAKEAQGLLSEIDKSADSKVIQTKTSELFGLLRRFGEFNSKVTTIEQVYHNYGISGLRDSIRTNIDEARNRLAGIREELNFNRSMRIARISAVGSFASVIVAALIYCYSVHRDNVRQSQRDQQLLNGIAFELQATKEDCQDFLRNKESTLKNYGSPTWLANGERIQAALLSGLIDDTRAYLTLSLAADLFTGLNEHNRFMASAAVDLMPLGQRTAFLKKNLDNFGDTCSRIIKQVTFVEPILKEFSIGKHLSYAQPDFKSIDYYPKKSSEKSGSRR